jgi:hypothetical protein
MRNIDNESSSLDGAPDSVESFANSDLSSDVASSKLKRMSQKQAELATSMKSMQTELLYLKEQISSLVNNVNQRSVATSGNDALETTEEQYPQTQETIADPEQQIHLFNIELEEDAFSGKELNGKDKESSVGMEASDVAGRNKTFSVSGQTTKGDQLEEPIKVELGTTPINDSSKNNDKKSMDKDKKTHSTASSPASPPPKIAPGDQVYQWCKLAGIPTYHHHAVVIKVYWDKSDEMWMLHVNDLSNSPLEGEGRRKRTGSKLFMSGSKSFSTEQEPAFWRSYPTPAVRWRKVNYQANIWEVIRNSPGTFTDATSDPAADTLKRAQFLQLHSENGLVNKPTIGYSTTVKQLPFGARLENIILLS